MSEIVSGKPQNEATEKDVRTRSSFDLTYDFFQTMRFGEYTPHFVMEGVDSDSLPLYSGHSIRSYTLGAPLMSDIKIKKDYFFVPMMSILPLIGKNGMRILLLVRMFPTIVVLPLRIFGIRLVLFSLIPGPIFVLILL